MRKTSLIIMLLAILLLAPAAAAQWRSPEGWQRDRQLREPAGQQFNDTYVLRADRPLTIEDRAMIWQLDPRPEDDPLGLMEPVGDPDVEYFTGQDPTRMWRVRRFDPEYDYEQWLVHREERAPQLGGQVILGDAYGPGEYGVGVDLGFGQEYGRHYMGGRDGFGVKAGAGLGFPGVGSRAGVELGEYEVGGRAGLGPGYSHKLLGVGTRAGLGRGYSDLGANTAEGVGAGGWVGADERGLGAGGSVDAGQQGFGAQAGLGPDYGPHGLSVGGEVGFGQDFDRGVLGGDGFGVHAGTGIGLGGFGTRVGLGVGQEDYGLQLGLGPDYGRPGAVGLELNLGRLPRMEEQELRMWAYETPPEWR